MTASTPLFEKLKEISILSEAVDEEEVRTPNRNSSLYLFAFQIDMINNTHTDKS